MPTSNFIQQAPLERVPFGDGAVDVLGPCVRDASAWCNFFLVPGKAIYASLSLANARPSVRISYIIGSPPGFFVSETTPLGCPSLVGGGSSGSGVPGPWPGAA